MDQGAACDRRHRVDGGHALSAAAVRLSLRGGGRIEAVRDVQGDGTSVAQRDRQAGDDRTLAVRTLPRLGRPLVFGGLAPRQAFAGGAAVGGPRFFFPLRQGFRRRPQQQKSKILSYYQCGTYCFNDRDRDPGGGEAVLTSRAVNISHLRAACGKPGDFLYCRNPTPRRRMGSRSVFLVEPAAASGLKPLRHFPCSDLRTFLLLASAFS